MSVMTGNSMVFLIPAFWLWNKLLVSHPALHGHPKGITVDSFFNQFPRISSSQYNSDPFQPVCVVYLNCVLVHSISGQAQQPTTPWWHTTSTRPFGCADSVVVIAVTAQAALAFAFDQRVSPEPLAFEVVIGKWQEMV